MKLQELDAVLRIYEGNFRNLHWNAVGKDFNDSHKSISTEYYEMVSGTIDNIAEILCMLGFDPCNYVEAVEIVKNCDTDYLIMESKKKYDRESIINFSNKMLTDICDLLAESIENDEELKKSINIGIRSELESILYDYTVQARYINARRMM